MANGENNVKEKVPLTPEQKIQCFKEYVTAIFGLLILACTLYLAIRTFNYAGDETKITDAKDILQVLLGVAGVVVGYYFGRVPADARATQAQEQANAATAQTEQISARNLAMSDEIDVVMKKLAPAERAERGVEAQSKDSAIVADLQKIRDELRAVTMGRIRK